MALALSAFPFLAAAGYLAALALIARRAPGPEGSRDQTFDIVVPARDEEQMIGSTVASLLAIDYPREQFRILVVADNCTDRTAERAQAAGARVLERNDATRLGKGHALAYAYAASLADGFADAVVVVDADTVVSPNLLAAFSARLDLGALALQADYGVRNATTAWRTRLMSIAFSLYHTLRSLGRERLGLSCGLRGNGMAFASSVLRDVPHEAFSRVEDVEYGVALALAGVRVEYVEEAHVWADMPETSAAARTQRQRWEGGRLAIARRFVPRLLSAGVEREDRVALDLAVDLMVPPLTRLAVVSIVGLVVAGVLYASGRVGAFPVALWGASVFALLIYVGRGFALAGLGARAAIDLLWAPVFAAWKAALIVRPGRSLRGDWVRTRRGGDR